jgi:hypothetical protein
MNRLESMLSRRPLKKIATIGTIM